MTSLAAIPAMIAASGQAAWGSVALGQAIGTIGGVAVGYGWGWFGPARIAQNSATERRIEYIESIKARASLFVPVTAVAATVAYLLASTDPTFAAVGALYTTSIGLTANWYFVGSVRPYTMLSLETLPRAAGTLLGVLLMYQGHSAIAGPLGMFAGMAAGFVFSSMWVMWETKRDGAAAVPTRSLKILLHSNRHGIFSALGSVTYVAAPIAIVSVVAPAVQPAFALADKVKQQIYLTSGPAVTVLQGWVPRGPEEGRIRRANAALLSAGACSIALGFATWALAPTLVSWLGSNQIALTGGVVVLMSALVALIFFQAVLERAVLASFEQLGIVATAILIGSIVGMPVVGFGAHSFGTVGALSGVLLGMSLSVVIELFAFARGRKRVLQRKVLDT
ncbi:hypothetical protein [Mycolicibacterium gilvum]|uniref:hypothetical protein n=1 Tax=Mycolicibacterium gilvum TaxID=1804 RepID=UPI000E1B5792|nr:hypothetical protein [Mycolicibacterium gilvum]MCV7055736.1 hypothetical protein [Mycolicibacterium gilvum]